MTIKLECLSRMGLSPDDHETRVSVEDVILSLCQEDHVSVKNKRRKNVRNINLTNTTMQLSMSPVSVEDGTLS